MNRVTQGAMNLTQSHPLTDRSHFISMVVVPLYFSQATLTPIASALDTRQKLNFTKDSLNIPVSLATLISSPTKRNITQRLAKSKSAKAKTVAPHFLVKMKRNLIYKYLRNSCCFTASTVSCRLNMLICLSSKTKKKQKKNPLPVC